MQKHIVFGAGLIGGFLGGVLTSLGLDTTLVGRASVKQKLANGLKLTDYSDNQAVAPKLKLLDNNDLATQSFENQSFDFLWITVKCTAVEKIYTEILPLVSPNTIIFCCQNGLGSDQIIKEQFPANTVLRVMVPFNVAEPKGGHLHRGSEGTLYIENTPSQQGILDALVQQINAPIMPVTSTDNMDAILWAKLQLNLGNSVNALADIPVKSMLEQRAYRLVIAALMKELLMVTDKLGIQLPKLTAVSAHVIPKILSLPSFIYKRVMKKVLAIDPTVRSSMWWDLSQGKQTEIDHLNGAVVQAAKEIGISCPANENIIQLVKAVEQTPLDQRKGGLSGKRLLEEIKK
ncbi:MAG: 2-dehydropantoate 2-reductase [Bacteroidota bacterium]